MREHQRKLHNIIDKEKETGDLTVITDAFEIWKYVSSYLKWYACFSVAAGVLVGSGFERSHKPAAPEMKTSALCCSILDELLFCESTPPCPLSLSCVDAVNSKVLWLIHTCPNLFSTSQTVFVACFFFRASGCCGQICHTAVCGSRSWTMVLFFFLVLFSFICSG